MAAAASEFVHAQTGPVVVYSNNPNALWQATGMQPIHFAPKEAGVRGRKLTGELDTFKRDVGCSSVPTFLVFYLVTDDRYMSLNEIKSAVNVQRERGDFDGTVFRVSPKEPAACMTSPPVPLQPDR